MPVMARGITEQLLPSPLNRITATNINLTKGLMQLLGDLESLLEETLGSEGSYHDRLQDVLLLANTAVEPPHTRSTPSPRKLRASFLAGYGLGNPIALLPFPDEDAATAAHTLAALRETIASIDILGLSGAPRATLAKFSEGQGDVRLDREIADNFFQNAHALSDQARGHLASVYREWYVVGELLSKIGGLALLSNEASNLNGNALALDAVSEIIDAPPSIKSALRKIANLAQSPDLRSADLFLQSQDVARAIVTILDVATTAPKITSLPSLPPS